MDFRIADTFTASLARLTGEEQKAVKTTAFDLQLNPASPGMSFHKLDKSRDKRFWSVRVSSDVRLIVHRTPESLLLCYVDHHDKAYAWAERRKIETHPRTGAAQIVEIRELVHEIMIPVHVEGPRAPAQEVAPLAATSEPELLGYGVPQEWVADLRTADEDGLLVLAEHLPAEAAEAVLALATGSLPRRLPLPAEPVTVADHVAPTAQPDPFEHPDARRRFSRIEDSEELKRALEYPWDRWLVFLHPAQRELVERRFGGPARVAGSAGTGKTVVAIHRAAHLARTNPEARVLLTTFSDTLANVLRIQLGHLIGAEPRLRERIDVESLDSVAIRLHERMLGRIELTSHEAIRDLVRECAPTSPGNTYSLPFLVSEWRDVVDAWQITSWESYRDVARLGRKTRLAEKHRAALWSVLDLVRSKLSDRKLSTQAALLSRLATHITGGARSPYDFVVIDEAQDVSVAQLRLIAALGAGRPDALFFTGDLGQRIFQLPFSWRSLGVDIRGRSQTLRVNYRTSQQIRAQADRLPGRQLTDVDGNTEDRGGVISVFNGPAPIVRVLGSVTEESTVVGEWLAALAVEGVAPGEMSVFVRSAAEIPRAIAALAASGLAFAVLDEGMKTARDRVSVGTMPLSKGLEFKAVAVMACDDEVLPLQSRMESVTDDGDLEDAYETERNLLYVACTRAREHLLVTSVAPASEFLDDLLSAPVNG